MSEIVLYHNPRCSKSRAALELLQSRELAVSVVPYLQMLPDAATLRALLAKLGLEARQLLRTGEDAYRDLNLADPALDDDALIAAMVAHPKLIERPIAVRGERAVVGRPPERVLEILQ